MIRKIVLPILLAILVIGAISAAASQIRMPAALAGYGFAIWGGASGLLYLGLSLVLPSAALATPLERIRLFLTSYLGVSGQGADLALQRFAKAHDQAERLARADNGFHPDLAQRVAAVSRRIESLSRDVLARRDASREIGAIITRADLAVEAVEQHARLRDAKGIDDTSIAEARAKVIETLTGLESVMKASDRARIDAQLDHIGITTDVADALYETMKGKV